MAAFNKEWKWTALLPPILVMAIWLTDSVQPGLLLFEAPLVKRLAFLETPWAYTLLHVFTFVPVLALSFDQNVHYYKKWRFLWPAILITGAFFIIWDVFFTHKGVWGFNEAYLIGVTAFGLPLEECLFFVVVPFACIFIYECLNFYVKRDWLAPYEKTITKLLAFLFILIGLLFWNRLYTATTFLLTGGFLLFHLFFLSGRYRGRFYFAYLVSFLPFMIVNGVLTGGYTIEPIVVYNPKEYLGLRISSIPLDDAVYGFLLLMCVTTFYEYFKKIFYKSI